MSNHEQIAQVTHDKRATVSDLLRLLMINKQMSDSLKKIYIKNLKSNFLVPMFYIRFFNLKYERFAHSLFFNERCEGISQFLTKIEQP